MPVFNSVKNVGVVPSSLDHPPSQPNVISKWVESDYTSLRLLIPCPVYRRQKPLWKWMPKQHLVRIRETRPLSLSPRIISSHETDTTRISLQTLHSRVLGLGMTL